jgi:hypothetical protein
MKEPADRVVRLLRTAAGAASWTPAWRGPFENAESGKKYDRVLRGGGLTNVPFLKVLPEVQLYEPGWTAPAGAWRTRKAWCSR